MEKNDWLVTFDMAQQRPPVAGPVVNTTTLAMTESYIMNRF